MATLRRWKIWFKMLFGKSILHVEQKVGKHIDVNSIRGYYNDLSLKVLKDKANIEKIDYLPFFTTDKDERVLFPIQIIQYALGSYEIYLNTQNKIFLYKMLFCAEKIMQLVNDDGGIDCMTFVEGIENPYSAMCQGEAISMFLRCYLETEDIRFFYISEKLYSFLTKAGKVFGICSINNYESLFYEYPFKPLVLNGFIFSIFGIYDYYLVTRNAEVKKIFDSAISYLENNISKFDYNGWTYYDENGNVASRFYHKLHISLIQALFQITKRNFLSLCVLRWKKADKNPLLRVQMFWRKVWQKIKLKK